MGKKIVEILERDSADELKAYLDSSSAERPLDSHEELVMLEHFLPEAVRSYINRFRFSKEAEFQFIKKAPADMRWLYINYYGLFEETQKGIIDENLKDAAFDFMKLRRFWDDDYLLDNASASILSAYVRQYVLEGDGRVLKLLHHENSSLFSAYVAKGRFISENVLCEIVASRKLPAFQAVMYRFHNAFKKKARRSDNIDKLVKETAEYALPEELQLKVIRTFDRMFLEILFKTALLAPAAQDLLFFHNFDAQWFKLHASTLYGMGGYRFTPENEAKLFTLLASKNLDDCLAEFRHRDDLTFVRLASTDAVCRYVQNFWLSDDAQVALLRRGDVSLAKELISRYSPEHGLCWQAEVELAKRYSDEVIKAYVSFHSLAFEAQDVLRARKKEEVMAYYFTKHPY